MYNIYYALHCNGTGGGDAYLGIKVGKVKDKSPTFYF